MFMRREGYHARESPLLETNNYSIPQLEEVIREDLSEITEPNELLLDWMTEYSFEESVKEENPSWWKPSTASINVEVKGDRTLEAYAEEVLEELRTERYRVTDDSIDPMTGDMVPIEVTIGDLEQKNGLVTLKEDTGERQTVGIEGAREILSEKTPKREHGQDQPLTSTLKEDSFSYEITADLTSGFFEVDAVMENGSELSSVLFMPYIDSEEALLFSIDSQFSNGIDSYNVDWRKGTNYTGNKAVDALTQELPYFAAFEQIPTQEIPSEAIEYKQENHLSRGTKDVIIQNRAWNSLNGYDLCKQDKIQQKIYRIALGKSTPTEQSKNSNLTRIGNEGHFIRYRENEDKTIIQEIGHSKDVFDNHSKRRT